MAFGESSRGSSSLRNTLDQDILDSNFGNEKHGSVFDAYMSSDIGTGAMNYDNFYMNGIYTGMNVAKTSYHVQGTGDKAIFAVCRGLSNDSGAFEASRRVFEYLDKKREDILDAESVRELKKNIRDFVPECNEWLSKNSLYGKQQVSLLIVVYAFSGALYLCCGNCSLFKINKRNKCKLISKVTTCIGGSGNSFAVKTVPYLLNSNLMLTSDSFVTMKKDKNALKLPSGDDAKSRVHGMMSKLKLDNPSGSHTCIIISENGTKKIRPSTMITAVISMFVTVISIINIIIQCLPSA